MKEKWKPIVNFPHYEVSNTGKVKRIKSIITNKFGIKHIVPERILSQCKDTYGYLYVTLCENCKPKKIAVHRIVALTFIDNPNNYYIVNHKDKNPKNNKVDNLEWCNHTYNANYSIDEILKSHDKERVSVIRINPTTKEKIYYNGIRRAAKENNTNHSNIRKAIIHNKIHKGYLWKYDN